MESETTILCMNLFNRSLGVLAVESRGTFQPFGEISGNDYKKIKRAATHVYLAGSGDFELLDNVQAALPILMEESPGSMDILALMILDAVNFYVDLAAELEEEEDTQEDKPKLRPRLLHCFVVGTLDQSPIRSFEMKRLSKESIVHSLKEIYDNGSIGEMGAYAAGTGSRGLRYYFDKISKKGIVIENDINVVFHATEAMKTAIQKDPLSGGRITIMLIRVDSVRIIVLDPDNLHMSHSPYSVFSDHTEVEDISDY